MRPYLRGEGDDVRTLQHNSKKLASQSTASLETSVSPLSSICVIGGFYPSREEYGQLEELREGGLTCQKRQAFSGLAYPEPCAAATVRAGL